MFFRIASLFGRLRVSFGSRLLRELHQDESEGVRPVGARNATRDKKTKVLPISTV